MRLRHVKNAQEVLHERSDLVILDPNTHQGKWRDLYPKAKALHLEIGMGKGQFILEMAKRNPDILFLGLEKEASVLKKATDKVEKKEDNCWFILGDAEELLSMFLPQEVDKLYLNFSDPWPKKRHTKRRLTASHHLEQYSILLSSRGTIEFKTDNRHLFEFSLKMFIEQGWMLDELSLDLHEEKLGDPESLVTTEYEDRFVTKGNIIYYVRIKKWKE